MDLFKVHEYHIALSIAFRIVSLKQRRELV